MCSACQAKAMANRLGINTRNQRTVNMIQEIEESKEPCIYELSELLTILNKIKENINSQIDLDRNIAFLPFIKSQINIYNKNCNQFVYKINENIDLWDN